VLHLRPLAEQRVGLVEEEDGVGGLGLVEDATEVLLRLADVLADDGREIDAIQVEPERAGHHLRRHRLAGAARTREQDVHSRAQWKPRAEAPFLEHEPALLDALADLEELALAVRRKDEIVEPEHRLDASRLLAELPPGLRARRGEERAARIW